MKKLRALIFSLLTFILLLSSESVKAKNIETVDLEESGKVYGSIKFYGDSVGIFLHVFYFFFTNVAK